MKLRSIIFCLVLVPHMLFAQSNVEKLVRELNQQSRTSFDEWKYSTDFSGNPARSEFNDAQWKPLKLDEKIYPDSCWIRKEITLPSSLLGRPVQGKITFQVTVDDYGYLFVNGEGKGRFDWNGEFELTADAKPGQKFLIAIKAHNTGGPLRLIRAQIQSLEVKALADAIDRFALSLRIGEKLVSFDTYQTNARVKVDPKIDKSKMDKAERSRLNELLQAAALKVNVDALKRNDIAGFNASLDAARTQLKPVADFAKRFTLYFDANAHIDAAWLWREKETVEVCNRTFSSVMNMFRQRGDFTYTQSSAAYYQWMETRYPDLFRQMQERAKEGRWEVIGGMWIEPDCNIPSGEAWMRQLLYAKKYFREKFDTDVKIGWNPDSFGYNWNMPQFYQHAGIDAFITQKIGWNETNVFPYRVFWWQAPDGSRILSYFPFDYVNEIDDPFRLVDWLRQFDANTGFEKMLVLFGVGDHGGGPSLEMLRRVDDLAKLDIFPSIEHGTCAKYLDWLKKQDLASVPVWNDELYLEYHQGTFTTQAKMKEFNRSNEVLLTNAEKFSSIAAMYKNPYRQTELADAWKDLMLMQFHDILPGSSIHEVYVDATETHLEAQDIGAHVLQNSLGAIAAQINTSQMEDVRPLVVFNGLGWKRDDVVRAVLPSRTDLSLSVYDENNIEILSTVVDKDRYTKELLFVAKDVPALGYRTYNVVKSTPVSSQPLHHLHIDLDSQSISNGYYTIKMDTQTGWIKSITTKFGNREILAGLGNKLEILEDKPAAWDAWNIGLTGVRYPSKFKWGPTLENDRVRVVYRTRHEFLKPGVKKDFPTEDFPSSFFTQEVILYEGLDRIDFKLDVDWWEEKTMLKVGFPLAFTDTVATYEIPYGNIRRSTLLRDSWEKAKVEVPAQRWADVSTADYGVSLLNKSKYGYDIKGNVMRLSLLRSPKWPDPLADRGKHTIEYSLYYHQGKVEDGSTVRRGYEINNPLIPVFTGVHKGSLPLKQSFVSLEPSNLVLTSIKKAEDSDAWIIQWYEANGKDATAELVLPKAPRKVMLTNAMEEDGQEIPFAGNTVKVETKKNSIVSVKVIF